VTTEALHDAIREWYAAALPAHCVMSELHLQPLLACMMLSFTTHPPYLLLLLRLFICNRPRASCSIFGHIIQELEDMQPAVDGLKQSLLEFMTKQLLFLITKLLDVMLLQLGWRGGTSVLHHFAAVAIIGNILVWLSVVGVI